MAGHGFSSASVYLVCTISSFRIFTQQGLSGDGIISLSLWTYLFTLPGDGDLHTYLSLSYNNVQNMKLEINKIFKIRSLHCNGINNIYCMYHDINANYFASTLPLLG